MRQILTVHRMGTVFRWDGQKNLGGTSDKESACQCRIPVSKKCRFNPWVRKIPWSRTWQPIPVKTILEKVLLELRPKE